MSTWSPWAWTRRSMANDPVIIRSAASMSPKASNRSPSSHMDAATPRSALPWFSRLSMDSEASSSRSASSSRPESLHSTPTWRIHSTISTWSRPLCMSSASRSASRATSSASSSALRSCSTVPRFNSVLHVSLWVRPKQARTLHSHRTSPTSRLPQRHASTPSSDTNAATPSYRIKSVGPHSSSLIPAAAAAMAAISCVGSPIASTHAATCVAPNQHRISRFGAQKLASLQPEPSPRPSSSPPPSPLSSSSLSPSP